MNHPAPYAPTPTPYRVEIDLRAGIDYAVTIKAAEGEPTVALIVQPDYCIGGDNARALARAKANAEFIVHRVNNWPALLAQLDSLAQMTANILDRAEREFPIDEATRTRLAKAQTLVKTLAKATT